MEFSATIMIYIRSSFMGLKISVLGPNREQLLGRIIKEITILIVYWMLYIGRGTEGGY